MRLTVGISARRRGDRLMARKIQYSVFAVADEPHCVWGWDLAERNLRFLDGLDEEYFHYIAEVHQDHLNETQAQKAAIALRANYHLSLETLFGLIGAAVQAPDCAVAWLLKARTEQIRSLTKSLVDGSNLFPCKLLKDQNYNMDNISNAVFLLYKLGPTW